MRYAVRRESTRLCKVASTVVVACTMAICVSRDARAAINAAVLNASRRDFTTTPKRHRRARSASNIRQVRRMSHPTMTEVTQVLKDFSLA